MKLNNFKNVSAHYVRSDAGKVQRPFLNRYAQFLLKYSIVLITILAHEKSVAEEFILSVEGDGTYDLGRFGYAELSLIKFREYRPIVKFLKYSKKVEVKPYGIPNRKKIDFGSASISVSKKENLVFLIFKCRRNSESAALAKIRVSDINGTAELEEVINGC